jgi:hypothetical protein
LTTSIAESHPQRSQRPVLRRLVDILPAAEPVTAEPLPAMTPLATDPAGLLLAERVLRAVVEILGGRRPARQLSTLLRPDVLDHLATLRETEGICNLGYAKCSPSSKLSMRWRR